MATTPPLRRSKPARAKPAAAIMSWNRSGEGKLADQFDEIAIGRAVAGDDPADRRNGGEGIGVVDAVDDTGRSTRENSRQDTPAALQHAIGLLQRGLDARQLRAEAMV